MSILPNRFDVSSYPSWIETTIIIALIRTSPSQNEEPGNGGYQECEIRDFAKRMGIQIDRTYRAIGESGKRIGPKATPTLWSAIEYAEQTGLPIVAFDETRFCREIRKLKKYPRVTFISLTKLGTSEKELASIRKRAANKHYPEGKGGRPGDMDAAYALPYILSQLGKPWTQIARQLGEGWSDNKVRRLFYQHFDYRK